MSNENVVPFRVVSSQAETSMVESLEGISQEQTSVIESMTVLMKFMLDNKFHIKNFICYIAATDPDVPGQEFGQVFSSPGSAADFALGIKVLENSFFKKLNDGGV